MKSTMTWADRVNALGAKGISTGDIQKKIGCATIETVRRWKRGEGGPSGIYLDRFEALESSMRLHKFISKNKENE